MAQPILLKTFGELYGDNSNNAHAGVYNGILAQFAPELMPDLGVAMQPTLGMIRTMLDGTGLDLIQSLVLLGSNDKGILIHSMWRYLAIPGMITPWDGSYFWFIGEVIGQLVQVVELPVGLSKQQPQTVYVPTVEAMTAAWEDALPEESYIPARKDHELDTEFIWTCQAAYISRTLVPVFLTQQSMQELWQMFGQPTCDIGRAEELKILMDWICVSSTQLADRVNPWTKLGDPPAVPLTDDALLTNVGKHL
jgi:hypothetical protein